MKTVQNITLFLSVLLLIGLVYFSFFNVYQTDDYIYSYGTKKLGFLGNVCDFYMHWGGRYFGYTINMLNPVSKDPFNILPKIYPIFLLNSFLAVVILNFRLYFNYIFTEALKKSLLFFFIYTVGLISLPEHYFWITGSNVYFLPVILSGLLLFFYGKFQQSQKKLFFFLSAVVIFILMGANEIIALLLLGALSFICFEKPSKENKILLAIGIIGFLISFLAPGNFNRMVKSDDAFYWMWTKRTAFFTFNFGYIFIKTVFLIPLFTALFFEELTALKSKVKFTKAFVICMISLLPLMLLGYLINIVGRQNDNIVIFFLATLSFLLLYKKENLKRLWWISLFVIFLPETDFFSQSYSGFNIDYNMNNFVKEIFVTDLKEYDKEIRDRITVIQNSKEDSLKIDKIKEVPKILYFDELSSAKEEKKYVNDQLEKFFSKKSIVVK
ncbi:DUF6056 family protein [Chryseobacterium gambrini]|uniref:DUF6056 family protein n=1 Tax=Chryseobacterium gambrini TaxID=373672 RepID=A0AAJ1R252_9FLAO|nr:MULTISPECIES: DUF6056 family protein [Chryseobacterium]MDN4012037.1 DUF6056 family protein [Chryseobacterium gambrini]MDN4029555.1 DUF6056 family protein [Chryseobacterium gambrini]QWA36985.1 hypothetical protein KKI44_13680 [Chryseobacterium sp. ZHDP1]